MFLCADEYQVLHVNAFLFCVVILEALEKEAAQSSVKHTEEDGSTAGTGILLTCIVIDRDKISFMLDQYNHIS